jgi:glycerol-3-phosphate O-acyltransferase/dihydroxyacetone phosphate acyltransferase
VTLGYRVVSGLAGLLVRLFYRQVEVVGRERIPTTGALLLAANHQNALVDPMLLMAIVPRPLRALAKAPLFRHPVLAPFLRLAGALPVHRRQDAQGGRPDPADNRATFAAVEAALRRGEAVLIFPEGVSQPEPSLQPLRTGAARMALSAHDPAAGHPVTLLPVGLVLHQPGTFRGGWALVVVGDPVPLGADPAPAGPAPATPEVLAHQVTDRLSGALRSLILDAGDRETLRVLGVAQAIWREPGDAAPPPAARAAWLRAALRAYRHLAVAQPSRLAEVRQEVERHHLELSRLGLRERQLDVAYRPGVVAAYGLREGAALLVGLPLALVGLLIHGGPYHLTALVTRLFRPTGDSEATVKLAAGVVFYPLAWVVEAWLVEKALGPLVLAAFLALLVPSGFLALTWHERVSRVRGEARAFFRLLADRDLAARLRERRRALAEALQALARLVPAGVLAEPAAAVDRAVEGDRDSVRA